VAEALPMSATTGEGVSLVGGAIARAVAALGDGNAEAVLVTNERHRLLLSRALEHVRHAVAGLAASRHQLPEEFVVADIRAALGALEEVTGRRPADALLDEIFAGFCIGK
jgi:tRNA modification GTPase